MVSSEYIYLCSAAFVAGFINSIVGGGGLIQLPVIMSILPGYPVISLLGTNKLVSLSGAFVSAYRFSRQIHFPLKRIIPVMLASFIASSLGAYLISLIDNNFIRPLFLVMLLLAFFLTIRNKSFGMHDHREVKDFPLGMGSLIAVIFGFYDGFFGPGTGTFLIIAFVGMMGMTFVQGSAYAKLLNLISNVAAFLFFMAKGNVLVSFALPMMIFNMLGSYFGVRFALLKGNVFVRSLLRVVIFLSIVKLAYDLYY